MSSVRRHAIQTLAEVHGDVRISGPGWGDWAEGAALAKNMRGENCILWYKPEGGKGFSSAIQPCERNGAVAMATYNEAWWDEWKAYKEVQATQTDVVLCHHILDVARFVKPFEPWSPRIVHRPHAAKVDLYRKYAKPYQDREITILLTGVLSPEIYPLRSKCADAIRSMGDNTCHILPHPGYRLPSMGLTEAQEENYAATLGNSKFVVCTASKYNYGLAKYVEAAMSGCNIVGDIPPDFEQTLGPHILPIEADMGTHAITDLFGAIAKRSNWRDYRENSEKIIHEAVAHHSMRAYAANLVKIFQVELDKIHRRA